MIATARQFNGSSLTKLSANGTDTFTKSYFTTITNTAVSLQTNNATSVTKDLHQKPTSSFACVAVTILILISSYLLTVTINYTIRKRKVCDRQAPQLSIVNALCVVATVLLLFECCWFLVEMFVPGTDVFCTAYSAINVTVGTTNRTVIYYILWHRQRWFYKKRPTANITSRTVARLSNTLLGGIIIFALVQIVTMSSIPVYSDNGKCAVGEVSGFLKGFAPTIFFIIALFQVLLLLPVVFPVARHVYSRRTGASDGRLD
uniref:Uncharacterized protein n=1 Tax=Ciona savignyi TaxID=51511 RepID=H2ZQJ9_CIOSA